MRIKTVLLLTTCAFCFVSPTTSSIILTGKAAVAVDAAGAIATLGAEMLAAKSAALLAAKKAAVSLAADGIATIAAKGAALKGAVVRDALARATEDLAAKRRLIAVASHLGARAYQNTAEIAVELPVLPQPALVVEDATPDFIELEVDPRPALQVVSPLRKLIHDTLQHKANLVGELLDAIHGVAVHQHIPAPVHEYQVDKARLHRIPVFANIEIGK